MVLPGEDLMPTQDLTDFILSRPPGECGIIYCRLRSTCDRLTSELSDADIDIASYHAGRIWHLGFRSSLVKQLLDSVKLLL